MFVRVFTRVLAPIVLVAFAASYARTDDDKPEIKIAEKIEQLSAKDDKELPSRFNFDRKFVVAVNTKLPKGDKLEKALIDALLKDKKHRDEVLYHPFGKDDAPEPIEVKIGTKVPAIVVRVALTVLSETDLKLALSLMDADDNFGNTQRMYVGGYVVSGKKAVTRDQLKEILDPKHTHKEMLDAIKKLK